MYFQAPTFSTNGVAVPITLRKPGLDLPGYDLSTASLPCFAMFTLQLVDDEL